MTLSQTSAGLQRLILCSLLCIFASGAAAAPLPLVKGVEAQPLASHLTRL
ncbi:MAG: hypothetical protein QOF48_2458, partial [Verrucomicrobiota bacterium]